MSLIPQPITPMPTFPPSTEEIALRRKAQSDALESLRTNHPELFAMSVSPNDSGVRCLKTKFGVDVTNDGFLEVLLRPHAKRICDSLAPHGRKEAPTTFMYFIVKDALNNLDIDIDDLAKIGILFGCNHACTDETYIHGYISYLRNALGNLHKLKTRTQKAAERKAAANAAKRFSNEKAASDKLARELMIRSEEEKRILQQSLREAAKAQAAPITSTAVQSEASKRATELLAARREEARRDREYQRILAEEEVARKRAIRNAKLAKHGKIPVPTADLLGLHSASAAAKPEEKDLLNMSAIHKKEIANDLASIFSGGSSRTRKHKSRKHRKVRKSSKSRKHTRK